MTRILIEIDTSSDDCPHHKLARCKRELDCLEDQLRMLRADFNDCNSERARHEARVADLERQIRERAAEQE